MSLITNKTTLVVHPTARGSVEVLDFKSPIDAVLGLLNSGIIGDGVHGSTAHLESLASIGKVAAEIAAKAKEPKIRSCNRHANCDAKRAGDDCCHSEDCEDCFGK